MIKNFIVSASVLTTIGFGMTAQAATPSISISCFGYNKACREDQITITNTGNSTAYDLYIQCPDKNNPKNIYKFWSFDLAPKETKCYSKAELVAECYKSPGIFVDYNLDISVMSADYPKWSKIDSCMCRK